MNEASNERELKTKQKQRQKQNRNKDETKIEASSNWAKRQTDTKWRKKAILYFAINRKNCSFYCFQSVFGVPVVVVLVVVVVASLSSLRKFACACPLPRVARGTWYEASDAWRQSNAAKTRKPNIDRDSARLGGKERGREQERQGGSHRVPGSEQVATLEAASQISRLNVMHKSAFLFRYSFYIPYVSHAIDSVVKAEREEAPLYANLAGNQFYYLRSLIKVPQENIVLHQSNHNLICHLPFMIYDR